MADLKVCDRCGEYMALGSQDRYSVKLNSNQFPVRNPIMEIDLCGKCKEGFVKWVDKI